MAATTGSLVRDRVASVVAGRTFSYTQAQNPFDFDQQPTGAIDEVFRIESASEAIIGGFNYTEDRTDVLTIWLARKQAGDPGATYRQLVTDVSSLRAAVIRDALVSSGDYCVPDTGGGFAIEHKPGHEYTVLRLSLAINYEATV